MKICNGCIAVVYCSKKCNVTDWPCHRLPSNFAQERGKESTKIDDVQRKNNNNTKKKKSVATTGTATSFIHDNTPD